MLGRHINHCEDSLTAAVFTHLLHLPTTMWWKILRGACYTDNLPADPGELREFDGWPNWSGEGAGNATRVVPDLFLRFPDFDLIIEAKRWDEGMQDPKQWERELAGYAREYGEENRPVRMIALGGIRGQKDERISLQRRSERSRSGSGGMEPERWNPCPVHMCQWGRLLDQCQRKRRALVRAQIHDPETAAHLRILGDLIDMFNCHGFQTGVWFVDLVPELPRLSQSLTPHHAAFQCLSTRLRR